MPGLAPLDSVHLVQHALLSEAQLVVGGQRERRVLRVTDGHHGPQRHRSHHLPDKNRRVKPVNTGPGPQEECVIMKKKKKSNDYSGGARVGEFPKVPSSDGCELHPRDRAPPRWDHAEFTCRCGGRGGARGGGEGGARGGSTFIHCAKSGRNINTVY